MEEQRRLVASWGLLADLCFSDLLLWTRDRFDDSRYLVLDHVRPTTSQTIYTYFGSRDAVIVAMYAVASEV